MNKKTATIRNLRSAQATLLAEIDAAIETASTEPMPAHVRGEMGSGYASRVDQWATRCGMLTLKTPRGTARVVNQAERLQRFAAEVKKSEGYGPARKRALSRDRAGGRVMQAVQEIVAQRIHGALTDAALVALEAADKAILRSRLRAYVNGDTKFSFGHSERVAWAEQIETIQREMVRRGLLDATDFDKVNAEPVHETVADDAAPLFDAEPAALPRARWNAAAGAWLPVLAANDESTPPVQAEPGAIESTLPVQAVDTYGRRQLPEPVEMNCRIHKYRIRLVYYWTTPVNEFNRETHADASWTVEKYVEEREAGWSWHSWKGVDCDAVPVTVARMAARLVQGFNRGKLAIEPAMPVQAEPVESEPCRAVPQRLAAYRRQRDELVPVLRRVRALRFGLRDVAFTERARAQLQQVLRRALATRAEGFGRLLSARRAWQVERSMLAREQGRQLENSGAQVPRAARNRALVDAALPVQGGAR